MKKLPRKPTDKAGFIAGAWEKQAEDSKFSNLTPVQFRTQITTVTDLQDDIVALERDLAGKRDELITSRKNLNKVCGRVVSAVRADPDHGSDSPLLAAMGYVTDSQRKSGKT